jgi:hypothetical protein
MTPAILQLQLDTLKKKLEIQLKKITFEKKSKYLKQINFKD